MTDFRPGQKTADERVAAEQPAVPDLLGRVAQDDFLKSAVLDIQIDDGVLVALVDQSVPVSFVEGLLARLWSGPIEVFCATDLMVGGGSTLH